MSKTKPLIDFPTVKKVRLTQQLRQDIASWIAKTAFTEHDKMLKEKEHEMGNKLYCAMWEVSTLDEAIAKAKATPGWFMNNSNSIRLYATSQEKNESVNVNITMPNKLLMPNSSYGCHYVPVRASLYSQLADYDRSIRETKTNVRNMAEEVVRQLSLLYSTHDVIRAWPETLPFFKENFGQTPKSPVTVPLSALTSMFVQPTVPALEMASVQVLEAV